LHVVAVIVTNGICVWLGLGSLPAQDSRSHTTALPLARVNQLKCVNLEIQIAVEFLSDSSAFSHARLLALLSVVAVVRSMHVHHTPLPDSTASELPS
jgi:hypothetical protein